MKDVEYLDDNVTYWLPHEYERSWVTVAGGWLVTAAWFWMLISTLSLFIATVFAPVWEAEHRSHIGIASAVCAAVVSAFVWWRISRECVSIETGQDSHPRHIT